MPIKEKPKNNKINNNFNEEKINNFIDAGGSVCKEKLNSQKNKIVSVHLYIPQELLKKIDNKLIDEDGIKISRNQWLLNAIKKELI